LFSLEYGEGKGMARKPAGKSRPKKSAAKRQPSSRKASPRKTSSKKAPPKRKSASKTPDPEKIIAAALGLAARDGWRGASLRRIADEAGVTLAALRAHFPSKPAIINGFISSIDAKMLAGGDVDLGEPARDRLFEVIMRRFDAMEPHRAGVDAVIRGSIGDTEAALTVLPRFMSSMAWLLEAAGLSSAGLSGLVRTKGVAAIYLAGLWAWLGDDTAARMGRLTLNPLRHLDLLGTLCILIFHFGGLYLMH